MDFQEVLDFADQLVFTQTGKHLDDVQETVIKGVWEGKTYEKMAHESHHSDSYLRDIGYKLWQVFSQQLDQDIKKRNFRSSFSRLKAKSSSIIIQNDHNENNHHFNFCNSNHNFSNYNKENNQVNVSDKTNYHDLKLAPKISHFCDRTSELKELCKCILTKNIPLISVLGLSGIGKSYLVKKFIDLNLDKFEVVIWRSLKYPQSLDSLINDFFNLCQQEPKETIQAKLKQLFDIWTEKKCLIILDDVQNLFIRGEFVGQYQPEYQDYQNFFTKILETEHQSSLILISQEQCAEMECLDEDLYPIKCLELSGLSNRELLRNWGLKDEDSWLDLINLYEGKLFYLKSISILINNNYDGQVADFLAENTLLITNQMQSHFRDKFNHLSPPEQEIVLQLSQCEEAITREDLRQSLNLSSVDFNNGLQSLQKRYLVKKIKEDKIKFKLSLVFREYVRNCCKD
jgi:hypothetical protein